MSAPHATGVPRSVVLSGYYGFGNVGDDALCEALTTGLLAAGVERICIPCGDASALPDDPRIAALGRRDFAAMARELRAGAVLFSGGGGLLQTTTSARSLVYYLWLLRLASRLRQPQVLGFQSIGPLNGRWALAWVRRRALAAAAIGVRDQASARALAELGVPADRVVVAADAAFMLPLPDQQAIEQAALGLPEGPRLALCLRATRHTASVLDAVRAWWTKGSWPGGLVLMACDAADLDLGRELAAELGQRTVAVRPMGPRSALALLGNCQRVVSERLHPLIFAVMLGLPTAAIDYDPKVRGLAADLGLPVAGTDAALTADGLAAALAELDQRGPAESERLRALAGDSRSKAQAELTRLLAALAR